LRAVLALLGRGRDGVLAALFRVGGRFRRGECVLRRFVGGGGGLGGSEIGGSGGVLLLELNDLRIQGLELTLDALDPAIDSLAA